MAKTPVALTIAGSDSCGGAGIQADLRTFQALGVQGASAITALTAQNAREVTGIHPVPAAFVRLQIDAVVAGLSVRAVKTGMLATREIVLAVAAAIEAHGLEPIVVDPVMVATSGARLLEADAVAALRDRLLPRAALVTPNLAEAAWLLGCDEAGDIEAMAAQARALLASGAQAVLLKGGHADDREAIDVLATPSGVRTFALPRIKARGARGTGCILSAAIAANLALGLTLEAAIEEAKAHVWRAIGRATADDTAHREPG